MAASTGMNAYVTMTEGEIRSRIEALLNEAPKKATRDSRESIIQQADAWTRYLNVVQKINKRSVR